MIKCKYCREQIFARHIGRTTQWYTSKERLTLLCSGTSYIYRHYPDNSALLGVDSK